MVAPNLTDVEKRMDGALEALKKEFAGLRTGRASTTLLDPVMVEAYGSMMPLKGCAAITTPDPRMIQVQPWDKGLLRAIEKALQMANIGVNPIVDGTLIRLPFPDLSKERRQEFVKAAQRLAEEGRVAVRHVRRDAMEAAKKLKKDGKISEDDEKRLEKDVQTATDKAI